MKHALTRIPALLLAGLLALGPALPVPVAHARAAAEPTWQINLKDAEIGDFIEQVARITGRNFVVDPRVNGRITIISSARLNRDQVYELFLTVLRVHGFAAVPTGDVVKIIQQTVARQSGTELDAQEDIGGDQLVTRVMTADNVDAAELLKVLRPLVPQYGHLAATAQPNVIIVTDHAENILRLESIVRQLDVADTSVVEIVELEEAWVGTVAALLEQLAPEELGRSAQGPRKVSIVANERNNTLVLRGKPAQIERVRSIIRQLDRPATSAGSTKVIYLRHSDAAEVAEIIQALIDGERRGGGGQQTTQQRAVGSTIQADESLNAIVIRAEPAVIAEVQSIVESLDVRRVQVLIEAAIVEVEVSGDLSLGVDLAAGDADDGEFPLVSSPFAGVLGPLLSSLQGADGSVALEDVDSGDVLAASGSLDRPTVAAAKLDLDGVSFAAVLQALATSNKTDLLSTPSILTLDNQEAKIVVGQQVPFRTGSFTTDNTGANNPFTTIERQDVGITLAVTPHIHDGEVVRLEVSQEVSSVVNAAVGAAGFSDIVTSKRTLETTILANDGETIVLGGLIQDDQSRQESKVPLLGSIPVVGNLFRSRSSDREKRNLMIFLRPTVLRTADDADRTTRRKYSGIWTLEGNLREGEPLPEAGDYERIFEGRVPDRP